MIGESSVGEPGLYRFPIENLYTGDSILIPEGTPVTEIDPDRPMMGEIRKTLEHDLKVQIRAKNTRYRDGQVFLEQILTSSDGPDNKWVLVNIGTEVTFLQRSDEGVSLGGKIIISSDSGRGK